MTQDKTKLRKQHRKSRDGCLPCKKRRTRCDERKPICNSCLFRGHDCHYVFRNFETAHQQPSRALVPSSRDRRTRRGQDENQNEKKDENEDEEQSQNPPTQGPGASYTLTTNSPSSPTIPITWQSHSIPPEPPYSVLPYTHAQSHLSFDLRLRLASLEKAVRLLSTPTHSLSQIHPVLSLHLKWLTVPQLLLNQESLFSFPHLKLYGPDPHPALPSPELYRGVEGEEAVIERKFGRDVETVVRGRTRTRVGTDMPGFEGEWMEARDVMEYLEERGVRFVGVEHSFPPPLAVDNEKHPSRNLGTVSELISSGSSISKGSPAVEATRPKFRGFLNLQVLIEYLGMRSYCIGPAPAMRKDDVDQALRLSIVRL